MATNHHSKKDSKSIAQNPTLESTKKKTKNKLLYLFLIAFTFIIYGNSIFNDYALDDVIVITKNDFVQKGIGGIKEILTTDFFAGHLKKNTNFVAGSRYRPFTLITFAIEYEILGENPHVSHFNNVLLFALCGIVLFIFLTKILSKPELKKHFKTAIPLITTLLFIAHPIHTEVVANIKSRDELFCLLFTLLSTNYFLNFIDKGRTIKDIVMGGFFFFLALFSKETSMTFLAIIPITLFFFRKLNLIDYIKVMTPLIFGSLIYFILRNKFAGTGIDMVVTNLLNNPLYGATSIEKAATIIYTIGVYFKLLVFPISFSCDYDYNQIPIKAFSDIGVLMSSVLIVFLVVMLIINLSKNKILSYSILFFGITFSLVSNILFPIGTIMSERFVFIPSIGFCLVLAYYIVKIVSHSVVASDKANAQTLTEFSYLKRGSIPLILGALIGFYTIKAVSRNADWKNNMTLFAADVQTCPSSANLNKFYGNSLVDAAKDSKNKKNQMDTLKMAKPYLKHCLEIYPKYDACFLLLGYVYYMEENYDSAYYYYNLGVQSTPNDAEMAFNFGKTLNKLKRYDEAIAFLKKSIEKDPKQDGAYFNLGLAYTNKGDPDNGLKYLQKVIELNPNRSDAYYYSGMILKAKGDTVRAKEYLQKAGAMAGNNTNSY